MPVDPPVSKEPAPDPGDESSQEVTGAGPKRSRRRLPSLFRLKNLKKGLGGSGRQPRVFAVLPTLLTLGNAACGFGAITFATKVGLATRFGWGKSNDDCLFIAGMLIFLAMVFDALDGRVARWAKQSSEFGAQLDSLCDAISFGAAPAIILVKYSELSVAQGLHPRVLWVIAIVYVSCALLRLARFNVETDEDDSHNEFSGLPSPAAAGTVASVMIAWPEIQKMKAIDAATATWWEQQLRTVAIPLSDALLYVLPLVTFASACLMVSRFRYPHIFNQWVSGRRNARHILQLLLAISAAFMVQELALPVAFWCFAYITPLKAMSEYLKRGNGSGTPPAISGPVEPGQQHTA